MTARSSHFHTVPHVSAARRELSRAIVATSDQLRDLIAQIAELTTAIQVQQTMMREAERRINTLETHWEADVRREHQRGDQRAVSLQVLVISAAISFLSALVLLFASHLPWW